MAGLYWQSFVLTQRNINKAIAGDPDENWLHFTKRRFFNQQTLIEQGVPPSDFTYVVAKAR